METANYKPGDEAKILELFKTSFKKEMPINYWRWRFLENPIGKPMIKLMWDGDALVGHYAVSPVELIVKNKVILSALSMTTMTHPEYGGQGIFSTLAEDLYRSVKEENNVKLIWGFPNNNSHYGFIKNLNWKDLTIIPVMSLSLEAFNGKRDEKFIVTKEFTDLHTKAFSSVINNNEVVSVHKTKEYLKWRYSDNPVNEYQIFEINQNDLSYYAVTKSFPSFNESNLFEIDIVEIALPNDYNLLRSLISEVVYHYKSALNLNITKINLWLPLSDPRHILFEKMGFINQLPLTYMGARSLSESEIPAEKLQNWYYSMGDSDVY